MKFEFNCWLYRGKLEPTAVLKQNESNDFDNIILLPTENKQ